jgi:hypothetical protein
MHTCSGYCLRKKGQQWHCRAGFGDKDNMEEWDGLDGKKLWV